MSSSNVHGEEATGTRAAATAPGVCQRADAGSSYGQILKSSAWIGGASVINIAVGILRTKALALMLGPAGFGLLSVYGSVVDLARSLAQMGVNSSGVRQIAEAQASGDTHRIDMTVAAVKRITLLLALLGSVLTLLFSPQISQFTFGNDTHTAPIATLSLAVLFGVLTGGQGAWLQGMRQISVLAKSNLAGAVLGSGASVAIVFVLRDSAIALSIVAVSAAALLTTWWFGRQMTGSRAPLARAALIAEGRSLFRLGFAFMASAFLMMGATYAARTIVLRQLGLESAGFYQAAWTLGGLYVGLVLQSMAADFYPRLVGACKDDGQCNRLVNEQAYVSLLLAGPGVIGTLALAPWVIAFFYSADFMVAVDALRWTCLGMALRVITWPMGFILVARGEQRLFFSTELAWALVNVMLTWICVGHFGLNGAGIAFAGSYVFHGLLLYPIVRRLSGFRWTATNQRAATTFVAVAAAVFLALALVPASWGLALGLLVTLASTVSALRAVASLVSDEQIPHRVHRFLVMLRLRHAPTNS